MAHIHDCSASRKLNFHPIPRRDPLQTTGGMHSHRGPQSAKLGFSSRKSCRTRVESTLAHRLGIRERPLLGPFQLRFKVGWLAVIKKPDTSTAKLPDAIKKPSIHRAVARHKELNCSPWSSTRTEAHAHAPAPRALLLRAPLSVPREAPRRSRRARGGSGRGCSV